MPGSNGSDPVEAWLIDATERVDLVASWEELCQTYKLMEFSDPMSDATRIEEFKWVTKEINRFLAAMRKKLLSCGDLEAVEEVLRTSFTPDGKVNLDSRKALAYQKHKQQWVLMMLASLENMRERMMMTREVVEDGGSSQSEW